MKTKVISVHAFRRVARKREREVQRLLEGVRVERAGLFQHAVIATENKGH